MLLRQFIHPNKYYAEPIGLMVKLARKNNMHIEPTSKKQLYECAKSQTRSKFVNLIGFEKRLIDNQR